MPQDDSSILSPLNPRNYNEYRSIADWLVNNKKFERCGVRSIDESVEDIISEGYRVARINPHYDPEKRIPEIGKVTLFRKKLHY